MIKPSPKEEEKSGLQTSSTRVQVPKLQLDKIKDGDRSPGYYSTVTLGQKSSLSEKFNNKNSPQKGSLVLPKKKLKTSGNSCCILF